MKADIWIYHVTYVDKQVPSKRRYSMELPFASAVAPIQAIRMLKLTCTHS